jgi:WD40 repeat protein
MPPRGRNAPIDLGRHTALATWLCLLTSVGATFAQDQATPQEQELRRQLQIERAARKSLTYQADMRQAALLAEARDWSSLVTLLDTYRPAKGETDFRAWEWHFLDSLSKKTQLVDRQQLVLQGPTEGIRQLAWSGNGERLAGVGDDGEVIVWDARTGKEVRRLGGGARFVSWDREGHRLTISAQNNTVTLWDVDTGRARRFFGPIKGLYNYRQPSFSPDGTRLALAVDETAAAIIDITTLREVHRLGGHAGLVSEVVWDPQGQSVATGSKDGAVKIWDAATGKETTSLSARGEIVGLQWGPDGRQLAAVVWPPELPRHVRIWDVARREGIFAAEYPGSSYRPNQRRVAISLSAAGTHVAAESMDAITVWETRAGRVTFQGPTGGKGSQASACDPQITRWAFLEMFGSRATCRILDLDRVDELMRVEAEIPMNRYQSAVAWSPDGRRLATGFSQGKVYVYGSPKNRGDVRVLNTGKAAFFQWSPDGQRFAFSTQGELRLGRLPVTQPSIRLGALQSLPATVSLSPDGKYLAGTDGDGTVPIWQLESGQVTQRLQGHPPLTTDGPKGDGRAVSAVLWSPDGTRLASLRAGDGSIRIWNIKTGEVVTTFQFGSTDLSLPVHDALPLVWSPDGKFLAARTGFSRKKVRILDVSTGKQAREWDGGQVAGSSNAMAWDPTSQKLASCQGSPPRIQIRNVATGAEELALDQQVLSLSAVNWSPEGRRLAYLLDRPYIYDLTEKRAVSLAGKGEHLVWKPDGSQLAVFDNRFVKIYDATTGAEIPGEQRAASPDSAAMRARSRGIEPLNYQLKTVVWNERGLQAAASAVAGPGSPILVAWDIGTGKPALTLGEVYDAPADKPRFARMVAWAPDGRSLASLAGNSRDNAHIDVWDAATGSKTQSFVGGRINVRDAVALSWSPDGGSLAVAGEEIRVWKLDRAAEPRALRRSSKAGTDGEQTFLAWSPDSRGLAVLDCRQTAGHQAVVTAWDVESGQERFTWTRPYEFSYLRAPIAWSPDGNRLAWGGPSPAVWNVATSREEFELAGHSTPVVEVEWSADGRRIVSRSEVFGGFSRSFELKVWDATTAREVLLLRGPMAGWQVAPGFQGLAPPPGLGSDPGDVIVWDLGPRS